jgi:hypothetical protein
LQKKKKWRNSQGLFSGQPFPEQTSLVTVPCQDFPGCKIQLKTVLKVILEFHVHPVVWWLFSWLERIRIVKM